MKEFFKMFGTVILSIAWIICVAVSAAILTDDSIEFEHALKHGPFPLELPAGHLLVTADGKFSTLGPNHWGAWGFPEDTACEAIQWDWIMLESIKEYDRKAAVRIKPATVIWKIVTKPDTGNWCDASAK